jgi:DNA polymerase I
VIVPELPFEEVWLVDFEFISEPGEHPDVVCLVAHELRAGQTIKLWRNQLGAEPPYRTDAGALFVCLAG